MFKNNIEKFSSMKMLGYINSYILKEKLLILASKAMKMQLNPDKQHFKD
jgi:hypothetical protein